MKHKNKKRLNTVVFLSAFALVLLPNFVAFADEAEGEFGTPDSHSHRADDASPAGRNSKPFR